MSLRSPLGRVLGMGSAKDGTGHWWVQRASAVALVPLTLWLVISLLALPGLDYDTVHAWASLPSNGFFSSLTVAVLAYHANLGTDVIIEDYVHSTGIKIASLLLIRFAYILVGGACIFAILRMAFGFQRL